MEAILGRNKLLQFLGPIFAPDLRTRFEHFNLSAQSERMVREPTQMIFGISLRLGRDRNGARAYEMKAGFIFVAFRGRPGHVDDEEGTEQNDECEGEEKKAHG